MKFNLLLAVARLLGFTEVGTTVYDLVTGHVVGVTLGTTPHAVNTLEADIVGQTMLAADAILESLTPAPGMMIH